MPGTSAEARTRRLPGSVFALAIFLSSSLLFLTEPARGAQDSTHSTATPLGLVSSLRALTSRRSYNVNTAAQIIYTFSMGGLATWMPTYFVRERGIPLAVATSTFGGLLVVAGQGEISSLGCRDLVLNGCVDILNVDATIAGGLTEWRRAATFAQMMNVQMGHHEEPQVAIHLLASVPNATYVEIFPNPERDPMWHELVADKPRIEDGYMHVPQKPGFGLTYNYDVIRRYRGDGQVSDAGRSA